MKSAKPHKNQLHFVGGIDNGFGNYKLLLEEHPLIVVPSYLSEEKMEPVPGFTAAQKTTLNPHVEVIVERQGGKIPISHTIGDGFTSCVGMSSRDAPSPCPFWRLNRRRNTDR
ncbi:MAG TPA: hypothetical protein V6D26_03425 [Stenomitos sp.]